MNPRTGAVLFLALLIALAIAYFGAINRDSVRDVKKPVGFETDLNTGESRHAAPDTTGIVTTEIVTTGAEHTEEPAVVDIESGSGVDSRPTPRSGPGAASGFAVNAAAKSPTAVQAEFERFVGEQRNADWATNAETLILDGVKFSAFWSAYGDWAVECKSTMCLTVASIDSDTYIDQQYLPQGGWYDMMHTVKKDIEPALTFADKGVSSITLDPETGRIRMLELWWIEEPDQAP